MQHAEIPPPHQHFHIDREAYDISATLDDIYQSGSQPPPSRQNSDRSPPVMPVTDQRGGTTCKKRNGSLEIMPRSGGGWRSAGALDDLFIECHERAADAAHFGHDHFRIYLCSAVRIVIFWRGRLRCALAHSLKADRPSDGHRQIQQAF